MLLGIAKRQYHHSHLNVDFHHRILLLQEFCECGELQTIRELVESKAVDSSKVLGYVFSCHHNVLDVHSKDFPIWSSDKPSPRDMAQRLDILEDNIDKL